MDSEQDAEQKTREDPHILSFTMKEKTLNDFVVGTVPTVMYIPNFITSTEESQLLDHVYNCPASKWKSLKNRRLQNWGGVVHEKGLLPQELPPWLVKITDKIYEESGLFPSVINHVLINEYLPHQGIMPHQDGPAYYPVVAILSLRSPVVMEFAPHSSLRVNNSTGDISRDTGAATHTWADNSTDDISGDTGAASDTWTDSHHPFSIILMPRSLLIFKDDVYNCYLHGIRDSAVLPCGSVLNETEACQNETSSILQNGIEERSSRDLKCIWRTETRVSLTCRLVLKVHKKLFKF